jgi:hypothetical protein
MRLVTVYIWILLFAVVEGRAAVRLAHPGYVSSIEEEKSSTTVELPLPMLQDSAPRDYEPIIFAPLLANEFRDRYEQVFGRTTAEQEYQVYNPLTRVEYSSGLRVSVEENSDRQRQYGEYLIKRLTEFHVDAYFRSDPVLRPVYELKERLSNYDVEVRPGYKLTARYRLAENQIEMRLGNPMKIRASARVQFNPESITPGRGVESELRLGYDLPFTRWSVDAYGKVREESLGVIGARSLPGGATLTLQCLVRLRGDGRDSESEDLFLVGWVRHN